MMHQKLRRHLQNLKVCCRRGQRAEGSSHRQCESPENQLVMVQPTHCKAFNNYKILDLPLTCDVEEKVSILLDYRSLFRRKVEFFWCFFFFAWWRDENLYQAKARLREKNLSQTSLNGSKAAGRACSAHSADNLRHQLTQLEPKIKFFRGTRAAHPTPPHPGTRYRKGG